MSVVAWLTALGLLLGAIYLLAIRYVRWIGRRLAPMPPMPERNERLYMDGDRPHCGDCTITWDSRGDRSGLIPCNAHKPPGFTRADWDAIASWGDHAEEEK